MSEPAPRFGLVIVGDEILSGKREDKHLAAAIRLLAQRGLALAWARYAGDDRAALTALFRETFASGDVVFSCGGIGSTPDDHTRQAAAAALDVPLVLHPEAELLIAQRCADMAREGRGTADMSHPENRQRLKMGEFPAGASIIPNAFNRIPGFSIRNHWFVPGFPVMAWPMIEWALDTFYAPYFNRQVVRRAFDARVRDARVGARAADGGDRARLRRHQGVQPAVDRRRPRRAAGAAPRGTRREGRGRARSSRRSSRWCRESRTSTCRSSCSRRGLSALTVSSPRAATSAPTAPTAPTARRRPPGGWRSLAGKALAVALGSPRR